MSQANEFWVVAEYKDGELQEVTLEMLGEARKLADKAGSLVGAVLMGEGVAALADPLAHYGADRVLLLDDALLAQYTTDAYTTALAELIQEQAPSLVLIGATANGKDLAPRLAARLRAGLATNCMTIKLGEGGALQMTRLDYGAQFQRTMVCSSTGTQLATIQPGVIGVGKPDTTRQAELTTVEVKLDPNKIRTKALGYLKPDPEKIDLTEADIIVSGGRGAGGPDRWPAIEELAAALGAAVGGSRVAMDLGLIPWKRMIGISGKSVAPKLYVAAGISGASHHTGGIRGAKLVIAINNDPAAPIFQSADLKVVADLREVLPATAKRLRDMAVSDEQGGQQ
ncbi:MAG: electron transfer flavoprotein subunit alpha/FixB family protein [Actinobacteria bacterium]|nr:electron transfer flavoprotein subunit alpha/FixB family protein [Actinomycetota bacterium]MCL5736364.1 electron transfer flavoprotein subunit alpha/FixB family protein [Actinomycetota bacterium]